MKMFLRLAAVFMVAALVVAVLFPAHAQAKEVARYVEDHGEGRVLIVTLHDEPRGCPTDWLYANWFQPKEQFSLDGCYWADEDTVFMMWADGDRHVVPRSLFKKGQ